jgi:hypothetical protein
VYRNKEIKDNVKESEIKAQPYARANFIFCTISPGWYVNVIFAHMLNNFFGFALRVSHGTFFTVTADPIRCTFLNYHVIVHFYEAIIKYSANFFWRALIFLLVLRN